MFIPVLPLSVIPETLSATPSTQKVNGPPSTIPPDTPAIPQSIRLTAIELLNEKHPSRSDALAPTSAPVISPSNERCHTRQVPNPAPSKSTAANVGGRPKIFP